MYDLYTTCIFLVKNLTIYCHELAYFGITVTFKLLMTPKYENQFISSRKILLSQKMKLNSILFSKKMLVHASPVITKSTVWQGHTFVGQEFWDCNVFNKLIYFNSAWQISVYCQIFWVLDFLDCEIRLS